MKTKSFIAVIVTIFFALVSCKSPEEKVISKLDKLYEHLEKDGKNFNNEDWTDAVNELSTIHEKMKGCEFTPEQLREIGKKEGQISVIFIREGSKSLGKGLNDLIEGFGSYSKGYLEGSSDEVINSVDDFNEIEDEFEKISKEAENIGKEVGEEINNIMESFIN